MKTNYENFSREDLIELVGQQKQELITLEAVKNQYMKHLEQVIEHNSVETYRKTVQKKLCKKQERNTKCCGQR